MRIAKMKNLKDYITEAVNQPDLLKRAKEIDEPFVKAALENEGWKVTKGTLDDDFKGIDLKVEKTDDDSEFGGKYNIDVKRNSPKNKNSKNFLLTIVSDKGDEFEWKNTDYFAFIDDENQNIVLAKHDDVKAFADKYKKYDSEYDNSKYILLPKREIYKLGRTIEPSEDVKSMLQ